MASNEEILKYLIGLQLNTKGSQESLKELSRTVDQIDQQGKRQDSEAEAAAKKFLGIQEQTVKEYAAEANAVKQIIELTKVRLLQEKQLQEAANTSAAQAKAQLEQLKLHRAQALGHNVHGSKSGHTTQGHGGLGGALTHGVSGIAQALGGGAFGDVLAGIVGGGAVLAGVQTLTHGITHLVEEFKNLVDKSGPLLEAEITFNKLTERAGINSEEFATKLSAATHGLVPMKQIYEDSNRLLLQNSKFTEEQIVRITSVITDYARAQGKNVPQAIETTFRALAHGRASMLAYQLGFSPVTIEALNMAQGLSGTAKQMAQFNIIVEAAEKQLTKAGIPALTFTERMQRLHLQFDLFIEKSAIALTQTNAFGKYMAFLDDIFEKGNGKLSEYAKILATDVGSAFEIVISAGKILKDVVLDLIKEFNAITLSGGKDGIQGFFLTMAQVVTYLGIGMEQLINRFEAWVKIAGAYKEAISISSNPAIAAMIAGAKIQDIQDDFAKKQEETAKKGADRIAELEGFKGKEIKIPESIKAPPKEGKDDEDESLRLAQRLARYANQIAEAQAKDELSIVKGKIAEERELVEISHKKGLIDLREYINDQKALNNQERAAKLRELEIDRNAKLAIANLEIKDPAEKAAHAKLIAVQMKTQVDETNKMYDQKNRSEDLKLEDDHIKAINTLRENDLDQLKNSYALQLDIIKDMYKEAKIFAEDYFNRTIELKQRQLDIEIQEAANKRSEHPSETADAEYLKTITTAVARTKKEIFDLKNELFQLFKPDSGPNNIQNPNLRYQQTSYATPISNIFGTLADSTKQIRHAEGFRSAMGIGESYAKAYASVRSSDIPSTDKGSSLVGLFETAKNLKHLGHEAFDSGQLLGDFSKALKPATEVVTTFLSSMTQNRATTGFLAGAIGGGGAAKDIGGFLTKLGGKDGIGGALGGALGKVGGFLGGPIGGLALGAITGVMGAIFGHFRKQAQLTAETMVNQMKRISDQFQAGNVTLTDTLKQSIDTRLKTIQDLSGKKGGRDQLDKILPGMDAQIASLQAQQRDLTRQLMSDLQKLQAPPAIKDQVSTIASIVEQYKQYATAVADVSQAYKFLQLSLEDYIRTQEESLSQSQQSAIQDALNLTQLLQQRTDMINQYQLQLQQTLDEGVLVKRQTALQNKLYEIDMMKRQHQQALEQLNMQIQTTQFKVDQERIIFNLSQSRVQLETQLVSLQERTIMLDMQRISGLAAVVAAIKGSDLTLGGLINPGAFGNQAVSLQDAIAAMYNNFGAKGYNGFHGELS